MKMVAVRWVVALVIFVAASFAFAGPFKSKIISSTSSPLMINVPDDHFLKITNFSQVGGTDRAVVSVMLTGDENSGTTNVLTATRTDTGTNSQNPLETSNRVIIAGPAEVMVAPVAGATLFITYKKEFDESGRGGGGSNIVFLSPTPFPFISPTPFPFLTPTPTPTPST